MVLAVIVTPPAAMSRPPPATDPPGAPGWANPLTVELLGPITLLWLMVSPLNRARNADVATPPPRTAALLWVMVEWSISRRLEDAALQRPPPLPVAVLAEMVEWVMVTTESARLAMPPPFCALLFVTVTWSRFRWPWFRMAPPSWDVAPFSRIRLRRERLPVWPTSKTRLCPPPETNQTGTP